MSDLNSKFLNESFIKSHIKSILDFYEPNVIDKTGGFHHNFKDNGAIFNPDYKHLVSSCRLVFNYCKAYELFADDKYLSAVNHGIEYIRKQHWDENRQGYNWVLGDGHNPLDQTNHCYGLAFIIVCFSAAYKVGIDSAKIDIERAFSIMNTRLWDDKNGLYADEATPDWSFVSSYRGQNANMHSAEAMLAAYEATNERKYLDTAYQLARKVCVDLADKANGRIWEHYTSDLEVDWTYNIDDPKNLYRPWGFQPGHHTEWGKLLMILHSHIPEDWMIERAKDFFDLAIKYGWDNLYGGVFYGFGPDGDVCDDDKYFWVQAETLPTAYRLYRITGQQQYLDWYIKVWEYAWKNMVDHEYGAWFRILTRDNKKYSDEKSSAGAKCDYHTIGACYDLLTVLADKK